MRDVILLKLGGSLITDKEREATARRPVIRRLASEIADALPDTEGRLLVGHGSGSFGHPPASRYGLSDGLQDESQLAGISLTQARAAELHRIVAAALRETGVPAFTLSPSSVALAEDGAVVEFAAGPLAHALERGLVPLVYGDVVLDRTRGVSVCSTELVLERACVELAERGWTARRAVWAGNTEGVYDGEGRVIPVIAAGDAPPESAAGSAATDVTGGMAHRVEVALRLADRGVTSWIGDGRQAGNLRRALLGSAAGGTEVVPGS